MDDSGFILFLFVLVIVGTVWMSVSRMRKQQQGALEAVRLQESLVPGQEVMTGSGLFGTVVETDDITVTLEISPGVTSRWLRPAIARLIMPPVEEGDDMATYGEFEEEFAEHPDEDLGDEYDEENVEHEEGAEPEEDQDEEGKGDLADQDEADEAGEDDAGEDKTGDGDGDDNGTDTPEVPDDASSLTTGEDDETAR